MSLGEFVCLNIDTLEIQEGVSNIQLNESITAIDSLSDVHEEADIRDETLPVFGAGDFMAFLDSFITGATKVKKTSGGKWKFKNNGKMLKISKKKNGWKFALKIS